MIAPANIQAWRGAPRPQAEVEYCPTCGERLQYGIDRVYGRVTTSCYGCERNRFRAAHGLPPIIIARPVPIPVPALEAPRAKIVHTTLAPTERYEQIRQAVRASGRMLTKREIAEAVGRSQGAVHDDLVSMLGRKQLYRYGRPGLFQYSCDSPSHAGIAHGQIVRAEIVRALESGTATAAEIAKRCGRKSRAIATAIMVLVRAGHVEVRGYTDGVALYALVEAGDLFAQEAA